MEALKSEKKMPLYRLVFVVVAAVVSLVLSVSFVTYRITKERNHREKWKDYIDCGLA